MRNNLAMPCQSSVNRPSDRPTVRPSTRPTVRPPAGTTLVELLVVLTVLGLLLGVSAMSLTSVRPQEAALIQDSLRAARATAIRSGRAVVVMRDTTVLRFLPDGRIVGGMVDPLTGETPNGP
jgi:Tfp pilus assembly protein FimT